jgi:uncharacterized repeat protein (TIGR01451 family)
MLNIDNLLKSKIFRSKYFTLPIKKSIFFISMFFCVLFSKELSAQTVLVNETSVTSSSYTVLNDGTIEVKIVGGEGGQGTNTTGGQGATSIAIFNVSTNDVIRYLVAEGGRGGSQAGGGGSTGVYINGLLVMVAGGGGGGDNSTGAIGYGANDITNGDNGTSTNSSEGLGGTDGNGGESNNRAGAGGGINTSGEDGTLATGGSSSDPVNFTLANGGSGTGNGGRGLTGGGAGADSYSGAGGGYSGGGGAGANGSAGGGGSYVNTTITSYNSHTITAGADGADTGGTQQNGANGSVIITSIDLTTDTDGDLIIDFFDKDDDNDGILDTDELNGNSTRDTDNDGIIDSLDKDSDGDSCLDVLEGSDTHDFAAVNSEGELAGAIDNDPNSATYGVPDNGNTQTIGTSQNPASAAAICDSCNPLDPAFLDSDGDSIGDDCDLDDDNDGVPDLNECVETIFLNQTGSIDDYVPLTFNATKLTTFTDSGLANDINDSALYTNVGTISGTQLDIKLTVLRVSDTNITSVDIDGDTSFGYLTILLGGSATTGGVELQLDFFISGTSTPFEFPGFLTFKDIDDSGTGEGIIIPKNVVEAYQLSELPSSDLNLQDATIDYFGDSGDFLEVVPSSNGGTDDENLWTNIDFVPTSSFKLQVKKRSGTPGYGFGADEFINPPTVNIVQGCLDIDTDGDGIIDRLDLDSDGDGCSDAFESGATSIITTDFKFPIASDTNSDGLSDTVDPDKNGAVDYFNTYFLFALDNTIKECSDFDNDGVNDTLDIDDDNDGVLDVTEQVCTNTALQYGTVIINGDVNTIPIQNSSGTIYAYLDIRTESLTSFTITPNNTTGDIVLDYQYPDTNGLNYSFTTTLRAAHGYEGMQLDIIEKLDPDNINRNEEAVVLIEHSLINNPVVSATNASITYVNPNSGTVVSVNDKISSKTTVNNGFNAATTARELNLSYALFAGSLNAIKYSYQYKDENNNTPGTDRRIWNLPNFASQSVCIAQDTDTDGVINSFDLDSDGDGCSDSIEAGVPRTNTDLQTADIVNGNGTTNTTTATANAQLNPAGTDNNNDGLNDSVDTAQDGETDYVLVYTVLALSDTENGCNVDLTLIKKVDKAVPKIGDEVIFTIVLKNDGPADATGVQVKDILPAGLTYVAANSVIPASTTYTVGTGIWDLSSLTIANGDTIELKIAATVNTKGAIITNKVEVFTVNETDKDSTQNSDN